MRRADMAFNGTALISNRGCDFQMYETVIAIDPSHTDGSLASIDFTGAPDAPFSDILRLSGL